MSNGTHDVKIAVLEEWQRHVDRRLDKIDLSQQTLAEAVEKGLREVRDDVATISRHVGRPLLSWPQALTLAVSLIGTFVAFAAISGA